MGVLEQQLVPLRSCRKTISLLNSLRVDNLARKIGVYGSNGKFHGY